jgi:ORF6N domain
MATKRYKGHAIAPSKTNNMNITILEQKIVEVRGFKVLLDADMATLYEVPLEAIREAREQNAKRFPADFAFELTAEEIKALPQAPAAGTWAFTEHGLTMLGCLLSSDRAVQMSVDIVRAFINLRRNAVNYMQINARFEQGHVQPGSIDVQLHLVYDTIEKLLDRKLEKQKWEQRERIGFVKG